MPRFDRDDNIEADDFRALLENVPHSSILYACRRGPFLNENEVDFLVPTCGEVSRQRSRRTDAS
jgi:hypothetical protein